MHVVLPQTQTGVVDTTRPKAVQFFLGSAGSGAPPDWQEQLAAITSVLESVQATVNSSTVLDASSTSELKQQQLNLKLKAKVREQKLQQKVEELEEELVAARKSAEVRPL